MTELSNQTIIIYKTYTPAAKRAQKKYYDTEKGKQAYFRANKRFREKHRDKINAKYREKRVCPHCSNSYSRAYLPRHIRRVHI